MGNVLTFDLGGSKVYVGILNEKGELLGEYRSAGANPTVQGVPRCRRILINALQRAAAQCGFTPEDASVVTGNAFQEDTADDLFLRRAFPRADVYLISEPILNAMLSLRGRPGYTFHSGTGSYVSYFNGEECIYYGGFGRAYGDVGSGYEIGRRGLIAAVRALEGNGPQTELLPMLLRKNGAEETELFFDKVLKLVEPTVWDGAGCFCAVTPLVFAAAAGGDAVANQILRESAHALADYCRVLMEKRGCPEASVFGVSGGVFTAGAEENRLLRYLKEELELRFPKLVFMAEPLTLWQACYACYCKERSGSAAASVW